MGLPSECPELVYYVTPKSAKAKMIMTPGDRGEVALNLFYRSQRVKYHYAVSKFSIPGLNPSRATNT